MHSPIFYIETIGKSEKDIANLTHSQLSQHVDDCVDEIDEENFVYFLSNKGMDWYEKKTMSQSGMWHRGEWDLEGALTSPFYDLDKVNPYLYKITITKKHLTNYLDTMIRVEEEHLKLLKATREKGLTTFGDYLFMFSNDAVEGLNVEDLWLWKDMVSSGTGDTVFAQINEIDNSFYDNNSLLKNASFEMNNKNLEKIEYYVHNLQKGDYHF